MTKKPHWSLDLQKLLPSDPKDYPYVVEDANSKALYFDARNVQSRMRKDAPHELELGYTRTMMGFLLYQPQPRAILIVGLGGGSLSKYCYQQLPDAIWPELLKYWHVEFSADETRRMLSASKLNAKNPVLPFESDSETKRNSASPELRAITGRWLGGVYQQLERRRQPQTAQP